MADARIAPLPLDRVKRMRVRTREDALDLEPDAGGRLL
jgi:hypothetical protein